MHIQTQAERADAVLAFLKRFGITVRARKMSIREQKRVIAGYGHYGHATLIRQRRYRVRFTHAPTAGHFAVTFHQSHNDTEKNAPLDLGDVLGCLTLHDPGDFEEFCAEYGYDSDSIKDHETYLAVEAEYIGVVEFFGGITDATGSITALQYLRMAEVFQ